MNTKIIGTASVIGTVFLAGGIFAAPASAQATWSRNPAQSRQSGAQAQKDKNLMRNVTVGLGAAAVYEAIQGKGTAALLLGAGAGLAAGQYEKDRKAQGADPRWGRDSDYRGDEARRGSYSAAGYRNGGDGWQERNPGAGDRDLSDYRDARSGRNSGSQRNSASAGYRGKGNDRSGGGRDSH